MFGRFFSENANGQIAAAGCMMANRLSGKEPPLHAEVILLRYALAIASLHDFPGIFECSFGRTTTPAFMSSKQRTTPSLHRYISLFFRDRGTVQLYEDAEHQTYTALMHDTGSLTIREYADWQCEDIVASVINRDILGMQKSASSEKLIMLGNLLLR